MNRGFMRPFADTVGGLTSATSSGVSIVDGTNHAAPHGMVTLQHAAQRTLNSAGVEVHASHRSHGSHASHSSHSSRTI